MLSNGNTNNRARKTTRRERADERMELRLTTSFKEQVAQFASQIDRDMSDVWQESVKIFMNCRLPILASVPCGELREAVEETMYYEVVSPSMRPQAVKGDYLLRADGDSMAPRINNGDLVMMRPDIDFSFGEVCAVMVTDEDGSARGTLKCVLVSEDRRTVTLRALNARYSETVVPAERVKIVGVLRGIMNSNGS